MSSAPELWKRERLLCLTWPRLGELLQSLESQIRAEGFQPSGIVSICKGGLVPAVAFAHAFGVRHFSILSITRNRSGERYSDRAGPEIRWITPCEGMEGQPILLVDDIIGDGGTMAAARSLVEWQFRPGNVRTAAIVCNCHAAAKPDFFGLSVDDWVVFPWETQPAEGTATRAL